MVRAEPKHSQTLGLAAFDTIVGAIFEKHPVEGEPALFRGSVVVYAAQNEAEVRKIIENDIYATSGVWDLEKSQIIPVCGLRYRQGTNTNGSEHSMWRLFVSLS